MNTAIVIVAACVVLVALIARGGKRSKAMPIPESGEPIPGAMRIWIWDGERVAQSIDGRWKLKVVDRHSWELWQGSRYVKIGVDEEYGGAGLNVGIRIDSIVMWVDKDGGCPVSRDDLADVLRLLWRACLERGWRANPTWPPDCRSVTTFA